MLKLVSCSIAAKADDTASIQTALNSANVTLAPGYGTYYVSSLNLNHNLNLNGNKIACSNSSGGCIIFPTGVKKKKLSNGEVYGASDVYNASGSSGIRFNSDSDTVANVKVHRFTYAGIHAPFVSGVVILNSKIYDVYYPVFIINDSAPSYGHVLVSDTLDNTQLATSVQPQLIIRGGVGDTVYNAVVTKCVFYARLNPTQNTCQGTEWRYTKRGVIDGCIFTGGAIGASIVRSDQMTVSNSVFQQQNNEAVELATTVRSTVIQNTIGSQVKIGIRCDYSATQNIIVNNRISGCPSPNYSVSFEVDSHDNALIGNIISSNYRAIGMLGVHGIKLYNNTFYGGQFAVYVVNSTGDLKIVGGTINNESNRAVGIYNNTGNKTDYIYMAGVTLSGTASGLNTVFANGSTLGTNVKVN